MQDFKRCRRIFLTMLLALLIFNYLALKLAQIQLLRHKGFTAMAVEQRMEKQSLGSGRGGIYDRHGECLLGSYDEHVLVALPVLIRGREEELVQHYTWIPGIQNILPEKENQARPYIIAYNVRREEIAGKELPSGILLEKRNVRYGLESLAAHVVGHLNRQDGVGVAGLEGYFDKELSPSQSPAVVALVDARRRLIGGLGYRLQQDTRVSRPYSLHLTLDRKIQGIVEGVMQNTVQKGAVVVMDPWTGDVLAMGSLPGFDSGNIGALFAGTQKSEALLQAEPFLNRSIRSYYPGSTFKVVVAAAYLESGLYTPDKTFECTDHFGISCVRPHGVMDLTEALAQSCNSAFIQMGLELGPDVFLKYAQAFGFGQKTGVPLPGEKQGNLPAEGMAGSVLALASMGQGDVGVTPLQLARAYAAVANGGYLPPVRLVDHIKTRTGLNVKRYPTLRGERVISHRTAEILKDMMHSVAVTGTGRPAASSHYKAAVKTGTAETGRIIAGEKELLHWIGGFAPLEHPRYTVVVFMEEARGNATHNTVFKRIMEELL